MRTKEQLERHAEAGRRYRKYHPGRDAAVARRYREKNPDKVKAREVAYREKNKEKVHEWNLKATRKYRKNHPDKVKFANKKCSYGVTKENFESRLLEQENKCAVCKQVFIKTPHIDHDHITDKVRDLLCSSCNHLLGFAHDSIQILLNAVEYLRKHGVQEDGGRKEI